MTRIYIYMYTRESSVSGTCDWYLESAFETSDGSEDAQELKKYSLAKRAVNKGTPLRAARRTIPRVINSAWGVGSAPLRAQQGADYNIIANYRQKLRRIHDDS